MNFQHPSEDLGATQHGIVPGDADDGVAEGKCADVGLVGGHGELEVFAQGLATVEDVARHGPVNFPFVCGLHAIRPMQDDVRLLVMVVVLPLMANLRTGSLHTVGSGANRCGHKGMY